ncbi:disulfide bond formation protein DsbA [Thioclava sp. SK-1]|uniref:DsbA family protein n=1 Tax=Thioclava sp. SK-1 TaxID=1889770 RepID=UPI000826D145|nr:DsbA family protein [Thioclava sp. SK-1]OCX66078.1 disulfide bond formation protein DsbA [Thioclava sp. SK-1]
MTRTLLAALFMTTSLAVAAPAGAFDITNMTTSEKTEFGAAVRDYLMEHPETLLEAINVLEQRQAQAESQTDQQLVAVNAKAIFEDDHSWVGGNPDGDVTVVEFMDYRCGYCKKAYAEVEGLLENDGNIRFVVKEFPILGPQSELAARFAIAVKQVAGDEPYARVHDRLMALRGEITQDSLERLAKDEDIDAAPVMAAMNGNDVDKVLQANYELAQRLQISGTPAFVIGDELMRGYAPEATMAKIVSDQRS